MSCNTAESKYYSSRLSKVNPATFYLACDYPIPIVKELINCHKAKENKRTKYRYTADASLYVYA